MKNNRIFLKELKDLLIVKFGEDINSVILFGSRAAGDAHKNSDYDVLIILNRDYDWEYEGKIISAIYDLELKYGIFVDAKIISTNELHNTIKGRHPLYVDAIQDGIHA